MDLSAATTEFQSLFISVIQPPCAIPDTSQLPVVCSGGTCAQEAPVPILYLDKELAVKEWLVTAKSVSKGSKLIWVSKPELVRFQITMADNKRGHRIVSDRWAVRSKFVVEA